MLLYNKKKILIWNKKFLCSNNENIAAVVTVATNSLNVLLVACWFQKPLRK